MEDSEEAGPESATATINVDGPIQTDGYVNGQDGAMGQVGTRLTINSPIVIPTGDAKIPNLIGARRGA